MAGVRKALIVATDVYTDPKLTNLNAPAEDARALAEVLQDPDVGAYEVETVLNGSCKDVEIAVARFFQEGSRDDTLLLHFSCHGVKDLSGELYFATTDTSLALLKVTGVASSMVKEAMEESRASLILCLVDCCYSGAFNKSTKAAATVDLTERLGGRGRAVITASTSLQLALDGQEEPSLFTHAVVEGLRSGEADRDLDGLVTLDEFYSYVHDKVTEKNPDQTPVKSFDVQGEVYVARRGGPITSPAPLPKELLETLAVGEDWLRRGAVSKLSDLLTAGHPGRALAARLELERVRDNDDSFKVRQLAATALEEAGDPEPMPEIPDYVDTQAIDVGSRGPAEAVPDEIEQEPVEDPVLDDPVLEDPVLDDPVVEETDPAGRSGNTEGADREQLVGFRHWRWVLLGSAAALAAILISYLAVSLGDGDQPGGGDRADRSPPVQPGTLPETVLLVPVENDGGRVLAAVDVETGESQVLVDKVDLPTLSEDRQWMSYMREVRIGGIEHRVAYLAQFDPVREAATSLLDPDARANCPTSSRPAVSLDGGLVALVCRNGPEPNASTGLYVARLDGPRIRGEDLRPVTQDSRVIEAPTWTGDNRLVFVLADSGPNGESTLQQLPMSGDAEPAAVTSGESGYDSHPDWSEAGVLFLRSDGFNKPGEAYVLKQGVVRRLTDTGGTAMAPTWSADGSRIAYLRREGPGVRSLWVQDADLDAEPVEIELDGVPGPPAWGAR